LFAEGVLNPDNCERSEAKKEAFPCSKLQGIHKLIRRSFFMSVTCLVVMVAVAISFSFTVTTTQKTQQPADLRRILSGNDAFVTI
jgi:hypothetical protein